MTILNVYCPVIVNVRSRVDIFCNLDYFFAIFQNIDVTIIQFQPICEVFPLDSQNWIPCELTVTWMPAQLLCKNGMSQFPLGTSISPVCFTICDAIKGNESLVEKFKFLVSYATFSWFQDASFWCKLPLKLDIWLQREFVDSKNILKQKNLNIVYANISNSIFPTSDSFLLIMSHIIMNVVFTLHYCNASIEPFIWR